MIFFLLLCFFFLAFFLSFFIQSCFLFCNVIFFFLQLRFLFAVVFLFCSHVFLIAIVFCDLLLCFTFGSCVIFWLWLARQGHRNKLFTLHKVPLCRINCYKHLFFPNLFSLPPPYRHQDTLTFIAFVCEVYGFEVKKQQGFMSGSLTNTHTHKRLWVRRLRFEHVKANVKM